MIIRAKNVKYEKTLEVLDTLTTLKDWIKSKYYNPLYKKKGLFFGSVYKKSLVTFKNTCGIVPEVIIDSVHKSL